jgi:predicted nucleic acid-binding protein
VTFVLDSWAVLALLQAEEPAASRVDTVLAEADAIMSWINAGEVHYVIARARGAAEADAVVRDLRARVRLDLPDEAMVLAAASLKAAHPMAYAGAFAAATAVRHGATLLTGDPELLVETRSWDVEDLRALSG